MTLSFRSFGILCAALCAASLQVCPAQAQTANRVTVIRVAYPAGGPADVAARKLQAKLGLLLGQPIVVENVPGAAGSIAATNVLNAPADGSTLLVTTGNDLILAPLAISQVKYRAENYGCWPRSTPPTSR